MKFWLYGTLTAIPVTLRLLLHGYYHLNKHRYRDERGEQECQSWVWYQRRLLQCSSSLQWNISFTDDANTTNSMKRKHQNYKYSLIQHLTITANIQYRCRSQRSRCSMDGKWAQLSGNCLFINHNHHNSLSLVITVVDVIGAPQL